MNLDMTTWRIITSGYPTPHPHERFFCVSLTMTSFVKEPSSNTNSDETNNYYYTSNTSYWTMGMCTSHMFDSYY